MSMSVRGYPAYKDSGAAWLGEIPTHWNVRPIGYFTSSSGGGTPNRDIVEFWNGDIPWVSPKDMKSEVVTGSEEAITPAGLNGSACSMVDPGAVLLVVRSGILKHTIPVAINSVPVALNQDMKAVRPDPRLCLPAYFARVVQGNNDIFLHLWAKQGATVESIEQPYMNSTLFPLPPRTEQSAIVSFLGREAAKIDALVIEQERLMVLLKEKRQAVISHAVTKGLDPNVPMRHSGVEWLGEMPAHWRFMPLRAIFRFVKRQNGDLLEVVSVYRDHGVIYKSSRDDNINKTPEDLSSYQTVYSGDLVVNKMKSWQGSLGVSKIQGITSPDYAVFEPIGAMKPDYLNWLLRCNLLPGIYRAISNGIRPDQWRLEPDKFKELKIPCPPREEQDAIALKLGSTVSNYNSLSAEADRAITLLKERRAALISAAVTGKIDVRGLVPGVREAA